MRCLVCKKTSSFPLSKPVKVNPEIEALEDTGTPRTIKEKKKKKKNKDIYAGLNASIVSAFTSTRDSVSSSESQKSVGTPLSTPKLVKNASTSRSAAKSPFHNESFKSGTSPHSVEQKQKSWIEPVTPLSAREEKRRSFELQITAAKSIEKQKKRMNAKSVKRCDVLKKILGEGASSPTPAKSLKNFLHSLK